LVLRYQQSTSLLQELEASVARLSQGTSQLEQRMGVLEEQFETKKLLADWGRSHALPSSGGEENAAAIHNQLKLLVESEFQAWKEHAQTEGELRKRELQEFRTMFTRELTESSRGESEKCYLEINRLQSRLDELSRCFQTTSHESKECDPQKDVLLQRRLQEDNLESTRREFKLKDLSLSRLAKSQEENMKPDQEHILGGGLDKVREVVKGRTSTQGREFSQRYYEMRDSYSNLVKELSTAHRSDKQVEGSK